MRKRKLYIWGLMAMLLSACVKEIPYPPVTGVPDLPVVHLYLSPDSSLRATCFRLAGLPDADRPEGNASLSLFRNGLPLGNATYAGAGIHVFSGNSFVSGDSFRLAGNIAGKTDFTVRGRIPNAIRISGSDTGRQPVPGVGQAFTFRLKFTDSALYSNYYRVFVRKVFRSYIYDYKGDLADSILKSEIISVYSTELPAIENNFNNYTSREVLFTDATFNGVRQEMVFYTTDRLRRTRLEKPLYLEIFLENLEKPLYHYYNTRNAHIWQQQSISQIPGVLQGNIPGAYGVVAASVSDKVRIVLH